MTWEERLGFACVVEGRPGLRSADGRRPNNNPHLRYSIELFSEVLDYLRDIDVRVFRLPSNFIPYPTHPDFPHLHWKKQIREAAGDLQELARKLQEEPLRLSFHPSQFVLLNSPRQEVVRSSLEEIRWQARILDALGQGQEARVLLHVGGVYGDRQSAGDRLRRQLDILPDYLRRRLALENDDRLWSAREVSGFCQEAGIPHVFDLHHHACHSGGEPWKKALRRALRTWGEVRPKIHLSSPRLMHPLNIRAHADYIDPWFWARLKSECEGEREFDVMIEAKKKDLALLALRRSEQSQAETL